MENYSDLTFLRSFTGGDPAKITKYVNMFLKAAPQSINQMKEQYEASDWSALRTAAHSLKSQVKYMGIRKAEELALAIERAAGEQTGLDQLPGMIDNLSVITLQACDELQAELGKL